MNMFLVLCVSHGVLSSKLTLLCLSDGILGTSSGNPLLMAALEALILWKLA